MCVLSLKHKMKILFSTVVHIFWRSFLLETILDNLLGIYSSNIKTKITFPDFLRRCLIKSNMNGLFNSESPCIKTLYALLLDEYPKKIPSSTFTSNFPCLSFPLFKIKHLHPKTLKCEKFGFLPLSSS